MRKLQHYYFAGSLFCNHGQVVAAAQAKLISSLVSPPLQRALVGDADTALSSRALWLSFVSPIAKHTDELSDGCRHAVQPSLGSRIRQRGGWVELSGVPTTYSVTLQHSRAVIMRIKASKDSIARQFATLRQGHSSINADLPKACTAAAI